MLSFLFRLTPYRDHSVRSLPLPGSVEVQSAQPRRIASATLTKKSVNSDAIFCLRKANRMTIQGFYDLEHEYHVCSDQPYIVCVMLWRLVQIAVQIRLINQRKSVTLWIALSPSTVESGCMDLVRGSHKNPILPHTDTHAENNLLSRGQEIDVAVADEDKTHIVLQPGEMSLHHGLTIHGSCPNTSSDRRIGFAIRYINPEARQQSVHREFAMLARGVDRSESFIHYAPPVSLFSNNSLDLYEEIREAQTKVLGAGLESGKQLYQS